MRRRWRAVAALGTLCALALAPSALAASGGARRDAITAFSDSHVVVPPSGLQAGLTAASAMLCLQPAPPAHALSLPAAVSSAERLLAARHGARALRAVAHAPGLRRERPAIAAAAGALATGHRDAALAALLRAHRLSPRDAVPLVDAAPLLADEGAPSEALAFLAAAARLRTPAPAPFGLPWKAVIANNRGYALAALHRWGPAEAAYRQALRSAPLLTEADQNLAAALTCQHRTRAAATFLAAGARRQRFPDAQVVRETPGGPTRIASPEVLDTSHGQSLTQPVLGYPASLEAGEQTWRDWLAVERELGTQMADAEQRSSAARQALSAQEATMNAATRQRTEDILAAVVGASFDPDIRPDRERALTLQQQISDTLTPTGGQVGCLDGGASLPTLLSQVRAYDAAQTRFAGELYRRQTALAANLGGAAAHTAALAQAHADAAQNVELLAEQAVALSAYEHGCWEKLHPATSEPAAPADRSGSTQTPDSPPCRGAVGRGSVSLSLDKQFSVSVSCEKVTVTGKATPGWLTVFGTVSHNVFSGDSTVFIGPEAHVPIPGPWGSKISPRARDGLYLTVGADGTVKDFGFRVEVGAEVTSGLKAYDGDGMNFSFVGLHPIDGLVGLFS